MDSNNTLHLGIDPTAGRKPFTFAVLDNDCNLITLKSGGLDEVLAIVNGNENIFVAVNGPQKPNQGFVKKGMEERGLLPGQMRGGDLRLAEFFLREKGITITPTPSKRELCPEWMQSSFVFFKILEDLGFQKFPTKNSSKQYLETHPHASFCVMLERIPLSKPTLEGRLQRQLVLHEANVGINNPMEIFEEITRHRLLHGILPMEMILLPEQLDALAAAYTAYLAVHEPEKITLIGSDDEGRIALPAKALLEKY
jgi:hypothetical protein